MTALRRFSRRRPFLPFVIEMISGDRIAIRHPEAVAERGELFYFRSPQKRNRIFVPGASVRFSIQIHNSVPRFLHSNRSLHADLFPNGAGNEFQINAS
jgi:hypothetical protein